MIEHADLVESIRGGRPLNEAQQIAESTLVGILGRESAYTGRALTWEEVAASHLDLGPEELAFGPLPTPPVPVPGVTTLDRSGFGGGAVEAAVGSAN